MIFTLVKQILLSRLPGRSGLLPGLVSGKGRFAHERQLLLSLVSGKGCFAHERLLLLSLVSRKGRFAHERERFGQMKVVNLLFQVFNPLPAGLILCLAPLKLRLEPYTLRSLRLIQRDQLFDICLYTFKHFLKA